GREPGRLRRAGDVRGLPHAQGFREHAPQALVLDEKRGSPIMKFSIFYEMQISEPSRRSEAQTFHDCLEQAVLADELGYHCVWEVEHHGLLEYSHSSRTSA